MLRKLAKHSAIYGVSTILGRLLSYLLTPYYTRMFSPSEYGVITDLYAMIPFVLVLLTFGMESSYFRFAAKAEDEAGKRRLYATTWGITTLLSSIFIVALLLFNQPISAAMGAVYLDSPLLLPLVGWVILFDVLTCVPFARLREQGKSGSYVVIKLLNIILQVGLAILFGINGLFSSSFGVGWVVVANLVASVITFFLAGSVAGFVLPRLDRRLTIPILIYSFPLLLSGVAGTATDFIDRQLIKYLTPVGAMAQLGIYGAVTKIAVVMTLFTQMYRLAAEPLFLANFKKDEFERSSAEAMKYYIIFTVAIFLGISLFRDIFAFIVGSEFREGLYILPVVLASNLLMGVWLNLSFWYKRSGDTRYGLYITLVGMVVSVGVNIVLIPIMGYFGAAIARLACESVMVLVSFTLSQRYSAVRYDLGRIGTYILLGGAIYAVSTAITSGVAYYLACVVMIALYVAFAIWREKIDLRVLIKG
ncbi:MAG: oligosaccharide flippase family protein [Rikenellaceae bacterium]